VLRDPDTHTSRLRLDRVSLHGYYERCLSGHSTGVVIGFAKILTTNCETIGAKRFVVEGITKRFIRLVVPRKCHVEHANESPFIYLA